MHVYVNSACALQHSAVISRRYRYTGEHLLSYAASEGMQVSVLTKKMNGRDYAFMNLEVGGVNVSDVPTFRIVLWGNKGFRSEEEGRADMPA